MTSPILSYDRVEISYGGRPVVRDLSFGVAPGHILGIVGESGSGKSTILRAAMGLLGPRGLVTRGDIWYDRATGAPGDLGPVGRVNVCDLSPRELRGLCGPDLAMVFQDCLAALTPIRRIGDQVYETLLAHERVTREESDARAAQMLDRLGLRDPERVLASYPFNLSGGMGQRVGLAIAMLQHPRVLLADEPTSALDVVTQRQAVELLRDIRDEFGTSIVIVTHNMGVVRAVADEMLVLKEGEVVEGGTVSDVLGNPTQPYTCELIAATPKLRQGR